MIENVESCGEVKNLIDSFYRTRKDRGAVASSYSYECKECTIKRITKKKGLKISSTNGNIQIGKDVHVIFPPREN
jgi:hypothetical protein